MRALPYLGLIILGVWHAYTLTLLTGIWYAQTRAYLGFVFVVSIFLVLACGFLAGAAFMADRRRTS